MAIIAWTDEARQWLKDIFEYIAADNPQAADRTVQGIYERADPKVASKVMILGLDVAAPSIRSLKLALNEKIRATILLR